MFFYKTICANWLPKVEDNFVFSIINKNLIFML